LDETEKFKLEHRHNLHWNTFGERRGRVCRRDWCWHLFVPQQHWWCLSC